MKFYSDEIEQELIDTLCSRLSWGIQVIWENLSDKLKQYYSGKKI